MRDLVGEVAAARELYPERVPNIADSGVPVKRFGGTAERIHEFRRNGAITAHDSRRISAAQASIRESVPHVGQLTRIRERWRRVTTS